MNVGALRLGFQLPGKPSRDPLDNTRWHNVHHPSFHINSNYKAVTAYTIANILSWLLTTLYIVSITLGAQNNKRWPLTEYSFDPRISVVMVVVLGRGKSVVADPPKGIAHYT